MTRSMHHDEEIYDDRYYLNLPVDSGRIKSLLRLLDFSEEDSVCEIGCAAGHFLAEIAPAIKYGVGLDVTEPAIRAANALKSKLGLQNIEFEEVSAQDFASRTVNAGRFDYVMLLDVTEHIDDATVAEILEAAKRLLKPGGSLVVHTPNLAYWVEQLKDKGIIQQLRGHIAVRNEEQYRELLGQAGFRDLQVLGLPHYRQPLRIADQLLSPLPVLGRLFRSRLFLVTTSPVSAEQ